MYALKLKWFSSLSHYFFLLSDMYGWFYVVTINVSRFLQHTLFEFDRAVVFRNEMFLVGAEAALSGTRTQTFLIRGNAKVKLKSGVFNKRDDNQVL